MRALDLQAALDACKLLVVAAARPISGAWPEHGRTHTMSAPDNGPHVVRGVLLAEWPRKWRVVLSREGRLFTQLWGCEMQLASPSEAIALGLCYDDVRAALNRALDDAEIGAQHMVEKRRADVTAALARLGGP